MDGVSWRLLIEDLEAAYRALQSRSPVTLPPRSTSFQRWSEAIVDYAASPGPGGSLSQWLEILAVDGSLPGEGSGRASNQEALARTLTVSLDGEETQALLQQVPSAYQTQINDVLLTALAQALRRWTGRDIHRIDTEGHGREEWIGPVDLSRTVGWFTTLYPVAVDLSRAHEEGAALKRVKETLRRVPDRGLSYGVLRYASPDPAVRQQLASPPPAELLFNYLGQFDQVVAGSELFRFADEPTGPWHGPTNERTHRLEVIALVRNGRFEARWIYGATRDRPEVVARLAEDFVVALRGLIKHCTSPGVFGYTPTDFPLARLDQDTLDRIVARHPDIEDVYPLSPMQRLFLSMEAGRARLGFEQWVFRLRGPLDPVALRGAWEATLAAHAMLRTAFVTDHVAEPLQVVKRRVALPWAQEDWTGQDPADAHRRLQALLRADRERGFELEVAPLNRVTLIRLSDQEHQLVWSTHHLYVDGWSWPLIFRDVGAVYCARREGVDLALAPPGQYSTYIGWLAGAAPDSRGFWKERLGGFTTPTPLPFEEAPPGGEEASREQSRPLAAAPTAALQSLARTLQVTLNTVVHGAWAIVLSHLSGRDDVVFGAAFSGRPAELPGVETLVGPCVNNLPVRVRLDPGKSVSVALRELHAHNLEIGQHQYASLSDIHQWAGIPWNLRVFDSLVVFQNYLVGEAVRRWGAIDVEPLAAPETTNYPLTLTVTPGAEIRLKLLGQASRFGPASLTMMLDGLATVLLRIAERPDAPLSEIQSRLPRLDEGQRRRCVGGDRPAAARGLCRPRQRDGARGRRGVAAAVPGRPAGYGGQFLRPRRPLDPAAPGPRAASREDGARPLHRRVAPVPDHPLSGPAPQRRRNIERHVGRRPRPRPDAASSPRAAATRPGEAVDDVLFGILRPERGGRDHRARRSLPRGTERRRVLEEPRRRPRNHLALPARASSTSQIRARWRRVKDPTTCAPAASSRMSRCSTRRSSGSTPRRRRFSIPSNASSWRQHGRPWRRRGTTLEASAGSIGVFAGMSNNSYFLQNLLARQDVTEIVGWLTTMMGNEKDYLATRVSYKLDLRGPALNIQTACSTSLVAVCTAVQSLLSYQCDMALAGGVSITLPQKRGYLHQEGGITSPDGHCRPFDQDAAGTVFSNGVGIVILRRLRDAMEDGDTVYAVIKGAGMNNDGASKVSFTAPSVDGHAGVIALAQALAGIDPQTISYVEAHGTATPLGDPVEIAGLTQAFRAGGASGTGYCGIGSVKGNIGHLDAAAGVAGLIKTALALHHKTIPPSLHFKAPNPKLDLEASPFRVVTALRPWESPAGSPRRAGVSSFGVGGTNAHVVLEEAPITAAAAAEDSEQLIVLSARSKPALDAATASLRQHLVDHPSIPLADVAFTLQTGRRRFAHRRALVARGTDAAIAGLGSLDPKHQARRRERGRRRDRGVPVPGTGIAVRGHGSGALRGRSRLSCRCRRMRGGLVAHAWASTCATCSIRNPAARPRRSGGSARPRSPSPRCS